MKVNKEDRRVLRACRSLTAYSRYDLMERINAQSYNWISYKIRKLTGMGLIKGVGCGFYKLTKDGRLYVN